jgi:hypothetical protein
MVRILYQFGVARPKVGVWCGQHSDTGSSVTDECEAKIGSYSARKLARPAASTSQIHTIAATITPGSYRTHPFVWYMRPVRMLLLLLLLLLLLSATLCINMLEKLCSTVALFNACRHSSFGAQTNVSTLPFRVFVLVSTEALRRTHKK